MTTPGMINEYAYQHALAMTNSKTFSVLGGADECFRYFASCYEAAKRAATPAAAAVSEDKVIQVMADGIIEGSFGAPPVDGLLEAENAFGALRASGLLIVKGGV